MAKFLDLDMLIETEEGYVIKNWNKYQTVGNAENYLLKNKERQARYREKMKNEVEKNNVTVTLRNAGEEKRIRKEIRKEENKNIRREESENGFRKYQNE